MHKKSLHYKSWRFSSPCIIYLENDGNLYSIQTTQYVYHATSTPYSMVFYHLRGSYCVESSLFQWQILDGTTGFGFRYKFKFSSQHVQFTAPMIALISSGFLWEHMAQYKMRSLK